MQAPSILGVFGALLVLGLVFGLLERLFRGRPGPAWFRRPGTKTDLTWWVFSPFVGRFVAAFGAIVGVILAALLAGVPLGDLKAMSEAGSLSKLGLFGLGDVVGAWPFWVQLLVGLFVLDFTQYWVHRTFHGRRLWAVHAVHHSSEHLDWLSSVRVHPVNEMVGRLIGAMPLLLLGFNPVVFAVVVPVTTLYAIMLHANLDWRVGPLRHVLASPAFHRWHHSSDDAARDKNFAGIFPVIDMLFETHYLPDEAPTAFGTPHDNVPEGILGQLAHPFRKRRSQAA